MYKSYKKRNNSKAKKNGETYNIYNICSVCLSLTPPAVWRRGWSLCLSLHDDVTTQALAIESCRSVIGCRKAPSYAQVTQANDSSYDGNDSSSWS